MGLRDRLRRTRLTSFKVDIGGLRLHVRARSDLSAEARISALRHWEQLESYVVRHSSFKTSFVPVPVREDAPPLVRAMGEASSAVGVGAMVTLSGALVEALAHDLAAFGRPVVVSTEGDTFVVGNVPGTFMVEPAPDPGLGGLAVRVRLPGPYAFYCSTGRVRIDPAIGRARAVAVLADHGAVADAVGSAMGSALHRPYDVDRALAVAKQTDGVRGAVVLVQERIGVWGDLEIVSPAR